MKFQLNPPDEQSNDSPIKFPVEQSNDAPIKCCDIDLLFYLLLLMLQKLYSKKKKDFPKLNRRRSENLLSPFDTNQSLLQAYII